MTHELPQLLHVPHLQQPAGHENLQCALYELHKPILEAACTSHNVTHIPLTGTEISGELKVAAPRPYLLGHMAVLCVMPHMHNLDGCFTNAVSWVVSRADAVYGLGLRWGCQVETPTQTNHQEELGSEAVS